MSNDVNKPAVVSTAAAPLTIAFDEAVTFFETVCKGAVCSACGASQWEIPTAKGNDDECLLRLSGLSRNGVSVLNLEIECLNCGLMRTHRADKVREWLDKPSHEEAENESV
ncbi:MULTISPECIES: hypothetical protein [unclassified Pseudomonas]|uniref:hypothetical protein n=1 Tax=unclassified Pseudomonas TaxID=196821 RepID=UPI0011AFAEA9|nr:MULTISPECIES: hypothetical protein [unclassified Pseudomonas]